MYPMVGGDSKQNFYWGHKEVLIPVYKSMGDAMKNHPDVDVLVRYLKIRDFSQLTQTTKLFGNNHETNT